jgi:hypothetical protein
VLIDNLDELRSRLPESHNHFLLGGNLEPFEKLRNFSRLISIDNPKGFAQEEQDI